MKPTAEPNTMETLTQSSLSPLRVVAMGVGGVEERGTEDQCT